MYMNVRCILEKTKFLDVLLLFLANYKCKRSKKYTISFILLTVNHYYFANIYHLPFGSHQDLNIEAP